MLAVVVEVCTLVGEGLHAEAVAVAALLVDEDDAVVHALVDRLTRAGGEAGGVGAVHADHLEGEEVGGGGVAAGLVLVPKGAPVVLAGLGLEVAVQAVLAVEDIVVVELPGLAELANRGDAADLGHAVAEAAAQLLPAPRCPLTGHGGDDVPPDVLHPLLVRPQRLAGDGAGLAAQALV